MDVVRAAAAIMAFYSYFLLLGYFSLFLCQGLDIYLLQNSGIDPELASFWREKKKNFDDFTFVFEKLSATHTLMLNFTSF